VSPLKEDNDNGTSERTTKNFIKELRSQFFAHKISTEVLMERLDRYMKEVLNG
jgi:hypothetical protein